MSEREVIASEKDEIINPIGLVIDKDQSIVVVSSSTNRLLRVKQSKQLWKTKVIAGNGKNRTKCGSLLNSSFKTPADVEIDDSGVILVTEMNSQILRRLNPFTDQVTSIALEFDHSNGPDELFAMTISPTRQLIVASRQHRIYRVLEDGSTHRMAGNGLAGFRDGNASDAMFRDIRGLAIDPNDQTLVIADLNNNRLRRLTSDHQIISLENYLNTNQHPLISPMGIVFDHNGDLIIAEISSNRIRRRFNSTSELTTIVDNHIGIEGPADVAVSSDGCSIFASAFFSHQVWKFNDVNQVIIQKSQFKRAVQIIDHFATHQVYRPGGIGFLRCQSNFESLRLSLSKP